MWSLTASTPAQVLFALIIFVSDDVRQTRAFVQRPIPSSPWHATRSTPSIPTSTGQNHEHRRIHGKSHLFADSGEKRCTGLSDEVIQTAEQLLPWEVAAEKQSRPVLDLSGGGSGMDDSDLSLSDAASAASQRTTSDDQAKAEKEVKDEIDWKSGSVWTASRKELIDLEILSDGANDEVFLSKCPQLARLPTGGIVDSAKVMLDTIGLPPPAIAQHPTLLSYPAQLYPGALEFLSNMMMLPQPTISSLCKASPELLLGGLDGYIQEQSVKNALGSAGDALYGVSRSVANDVGKTMRDGKAGQKGL